MGVAFGVQLLRMCMCVSNAVYMCVCVYRMLCIYGWWLCVISLPITWRAFVYPMLGSAEIICHRMARHLMGVHVKWTPMVITTMTCCHCITPSRVVKSFDRVACQTNTLASLGLFMHICCVYAAFTLTQATCHGRETCILTLWLRFGTLSAL